MRMSHFALEGPHPLRALGFLPWTLGPGPVLTPHLPCLVHPSKVSESEKSQLVNETRWQYYGTEGTLGNLTLTWNTSALPTNSITVELGGYEETGEASRAPLQAASAGPGGDQSLGVGEGITA